MKSYEYEAAEALGLTITPESYLCELTCAFSAYRHLCLHSCTGHRGRAALPCASERGVSFCWPQMKIKRFSKVTSTLGIYLIKI